MRKDGKIIKDFIEKTKMNPMHVISFFFYLKETFSNNLKACEITMVLRNYNVEQCQE